MADKLTLLHLAGLNNWALAGKRWAWDRLAVEAREYMKAGEPLPPVLREWAIDALAGDPPKGQRNDRRDFDIQIAVRILKARGHSERAAVRMVAPVVNLSPEAVHSVLRRFKAGPFPPAV